MFSNFFIFCEDSCHLFLPWPLYFTLKPACLTFTANWGSRGVWGKDSTRQIMLLILPIPG